MLQGMWITSFHSAYVPIPDADVRRLNRYVVENAHREVYASVKSAGFTMLVNKRMKN
jgi:cation transport regulator ChaB